MSRFYSVVGFAFLALAACSTGEPSVAVRGARASLDAVLVGAEVDTDVAPPLVPTHRGRRPIAASGPGETVLVVYNDLELNTVIRPAVAMLVGLDGHIVWRRDIPLGVGEQYDAIARHDTGWALLTWGDEVGGYGSRLRAIAADGTVGPPVEIVSRTDTFGIPSLACTDSTCMAAWTGTDGTPSRAHVARFSADPLVRLDTTPLLPVGRTGEEMNSLAVSSRPGSFLMTWTESIVLYAAPLSTAGVFAPAALVTGPYAFAPGTMAWDGTQWLGFATTAAGSVAIARDADALFVSTAPIDAYTADARIACAGPRACVAAPASVRGSPAAIIQPSRGTEIWAPMVTPSASAAAVAVAGTTPVIVLTNGEDVRLAPAAPPFDAASGVIIDRAAPAQTQVAIARGSTAVGMPAGLVVWRERDTNTHIRLATIAADGSLGAARTLASGAPAVGLEPATEVGLPAVAFDGTRYLVAWATRWTGYSTSWVDTQRVSVLGEPLDVTPGRIASSSSIGFQEVHVAGSPLGFAVVHRDGERTELSRVASSGALLDARLITSTYADREFAIAWSGTDYWVVWSAPSSRAQDVVCRRYGADGASLDASPFPIGSASLDQVSPSVALGGGEMFVAWSDFSDSATATVRGARVTLAGVVRDIDGIALFAAPPPATEAVYPHVAWDGVGWVVVGGLSDGSAPDLGDSRHGIIGVRLSDTGAVLDGTPFVVSDGLVLGQAALLPRADEAMSVGYVRFDRDAPYETRRLRLRTLSTVREAAVTDAGIEPIDAGAASDAGIEPIDAGADVDGSVAPDAGAVDAGSLVDAGVRPPPSPDDGGCSVTRGHNSSDFVSWSVVLLLVVTRSVARRRRPRDRCGSARR